MRLGYERTNPMDMPKIPHTTVRIPSHSRGDTRLMMRLEGTVEIGPAPLVNGHVGSSKAENRHLSPSEAM
jgi:hypothetical protein